ncbi:MAG TPA: hypothetical protein VIK18_04000 [Pirellulales bacterium]
MLARLPDLRVARQPAVEPPAWQPASSQQPSSQPAASSPRDSAARVPAAASVEMPDDLKSEFFEPQGLPALDRVWQDTRQWFSKHAKVAMFVVALLASQSLMLMWRQAPAQRQTDQVLQPLGALQDSPASETSQQLHPVPMETDVAVERMPAADAPSTPVIDEPHLALPRPQPDPISMSAAPHLTSPDKPAEQPKLAALLRRDAGRAPPHEHGQPTDSLGSAPAKPAVPTIDEKDVPPWESWSDDKASAAPTSPATEAAAEAAPTLAPPDGSGTITTQPDEARTASLATDRPSSRAGSVQRPRAVAKFKGTINKPLAEPANERTRRSLY